MISLLVLLVTLILFGGCRNSDKVSSLDHDFQFMVELEEKASLKIERETASCQERLAKMWNAILTDTFYVQVIVSANRDSLILAEKIFSSPEPEMIKAVLDFIDNGVTEHASFFQDVVARHHRLAQECIATSQTARQRIDHLSTMRERLDRFTMETNK